MINQAQYDRLIRVKEQLMAAGDIEPEDAAEEAADQLGMNYEEVLEFEFLAG